MIGNLTKNLRRRNTVSAFLMKNGETTVVQETAQFEVSNADQRWKDWCLSPIMPGGVTLH